MARFVASMLGDVPTGGPLRLLDPGAGVGSLTAAAVEHLVSGRPWTRQSIHVVAYEVDGDLHGLLGRTLEDCREYASKNRVELTYELRGADYVEAVAGHPELGDATELFDAVIMNPPYRKIGVRSPERKALESIGLRVANLYTAFLALAAEQLARGGVLAAITPRSFANGLYHEPFRWHFFERVAMERLHVFEARGLVFADSEVLQENVIFAVTRGGVRDSVRVSSSRGVGDERVARDVSSDEVIRPDDPHRFLRIPIDEHDTLLAEVMAELPVTLAALGLSVSTGRVVDFRAREYLRARPGPDTVPLIYPGHLRDGRVHWPSANGAGKPNAFVRTGDTEKLLLPNESYVLVKRFTAKEERRRVSAAVTHPSEIPSDALAIENHLNVFHERNRGLVPELAAGLAAYLNSSLVDRYIRLFSGHTQINATDLRHLRYPTREQLEALGREVQRRRPPDQKTLDDLVEEGISIHVRRTDREAGTPAAVAEGTP